MKTNLEETESACGAFGKYLYRFATSVFIDVAVTSQTQNQIENSEKGYGK